MKIITMKNRDVIRQEIESWAAEVGWKNVALCVAKQRTDFQQSAATARDLHNIEQQIKRALRGDTAHYRRQAADMASVLVAALPAERRARLLDPDNPVFLASVAARDAIGAANAVHLRAPADVIERKINQAIAAFIAIKQAVLNRTAVA